MGAIYNIAFAAYLLALLAGIMSLFWKRWRLGLVNIVFIGAGAAAQTVYMGLRWVEAGRAPFSNMFESLVLFSWSVAVIFLFLQKRTKLAALGTFTAIMTVAVTACASAFFSSNIEPLVPALRSNWLAFHVFSCFLGYGGFALSAFAASIYLFGGRAGNEVYLESQETLERLVAKTISFGFLFLTLGIITGAVWANSAWGTYWSWDPKETWSLITWLIYAGYLHCRYMRGWRGGVTAWISLLGFVSVLFTYFGVNYLLKSLHSYA